MKKTRVGISGSILINQEDTFTGYIRSYANEDYVNSIVNNGGIPYILPIVEDKAAIKEQVANIDALLLTGGYDVDPYYYGEEPNMKLGEIMPRRDEFELKLLKEAIERNIPILGICRGLQLMNIYHGGSLYQDLSLNKDIVIKHDQVNTPNILTHGINIDEDTKLFEILKVKNMRVNSFHHQVINKLGDGFRVSAQSNDGVIEAIEHEDYNFMVGLQFHPEMLHKDYEIMNEIFKCFIRAGQV